MTTKSDILRRSALGLSALVLAAATVHADEPAVVANSYQVSGTLKLGGEGRWDYISIDPATHLVYVPRSSHVQIVRENTGEVVADLPDTAGVHGVAIAPDLNRGFTSNGKSGTVTIFDLKTNAVLGTSKAGENPDAILYDVASKKVFVFNGKSKDVTVLDATAAPGAAAVATIPLGGKPEFSASDEAGRVYVNIEDTNSIVAIDSKSLKIAATWKLEGADEPSGLAIDVAGHRLFAGCGGNNVMAVVDTQSGKTLATLPIGKGVDGCAFDPVTKCAFASCGADDGTLTVVKETAPGKFEVVQNLKTRAGARTVAVDVATHAVYLPTAEMAAAKLGDKRPTAKPNSFMLVVVAPSANSPK